MADDENTENVGYTKLMQLGSISWELTRHEWDCGDGCCSTSGWTAEFANFSHGEEDRNGHLTEAEFVTCAIDAYLVHRDGLTISAAQVNRDGAMQLLRDENNSIFQLLGWLYSHVSDMQDADAFAKTKRAQVFKVSTHKLLRAIYSVAPHSILLASGHYRDGAAQAIELQAAQEITQS